MIKIVAGKYGPKLLGPGTILNLDTASEERLVKNKVAVFINERAKDDGQTEDEQSEENSEINIKTIEELQKLKSKKDLIQYAESVGLHNLEESDSKTSLVDSIANYLEENFE